MKVCLIARKNTTHSLEELHRHLRLRMQMLLGVHLMQAVQRWLEVSFPKKLIDKKMEQESQIRHRPCPSLRIKQTVAINSDSNFNLRLMPI